MDSMIISGVVVPAPVEFPLPLLPCLACFFISLYKSYLLCVLFNYFEIIHITITKTRKKKYSS